MSRICETVESYGGAIRSYMGDGVAGFFGIDRARENDAVCAAQAALDVLRLVKDYAAQVEATWGVTDFNVRVGINSGRVAVGNVGAADPQRVALGDAVNVAARLQALAKPGMAIVGEEVARLIAHRFVLQGVGHLQMKGRSAPVKAYELTSEAPRALKGSLARFVGRDDELRRIERALRDLADGRGQICVVSGEGGIGKSRLVDEARLRAAPDVLWLGGTCDQVGRQLPYEPFVQAIRSWLGVDRTSSPIQTRIRLRARGRELIGDPFDEFAPYLCRLLGVALGTKADGTLDGLPGEVLRKALTDGYVNWLSALASVQPVVLSLDDFELASDSTVELAFELLARLETVPILLLITTRSDPQSPGRDLHAQAMLESAHRAVNIQLGPLNTHESSVLLQSLSSVSTLDEAFENLVISRAEGNPLYMEELFNAVVLGEERAPQLAKSLPEALERLLLSRIDRLPPDARNVLQCAAVLGRSFAWGVLDGMVDSQTLEVGLKALLRADLVREKGRSPARYEFKHGLVREAALSTLNPERYRALNASAARALRGWKEFNFERDAESVASYCLAAEDMPHAVEVIEVLGDWHARVFRWEEASALFRACLDEYRRTEAHADFARVAQKEADLLSLRGDFEQAAALVDGAVAGLGNLDAKRLLKVSKARYLSDAGMDDAAFATLEELDAEEGGCTDPQFIVLMGTVALHRSDEDTVERCLRDLGDFDLLPHDARFEAASLAAGAAATKGELDDAELWAVRAQLFAAQGGQVLQQLTARRHIALICFLKGCVRQSYDLMRSVYEQCLALGWKTGEMEAVLSLLHVGSLCGALDEVAAIGKHTLAEALPDVWRGLVAANLSGLQVARGEYDDAKELADEALRRGAFLPSWATMAARLSLVTLAECTGDHTLFSLQMRLVGEEAVKDSSRPHAMALAVLVVHLVKSGEMESADRYADLARSAISQFDRPTAAIVERLLLAAAMAEEEAARSISELERILVDVREMGLGVEEGELYLLLAEADEDNRERYLAHAERAYRECGAHGYLPLVQQMRAKVRPRSFA